MRIVVINDFGVVRGGADQVAISSVMALAAAGREVEFWVACGPFDPRLEKLERVTLVDLDLGPGGGEEGAVGALSRGLWNRKTGSAVTRELGRVKSDAVIVHVHGWTKHLSPAIFHVLRKSGVPVLVTLHDYVAACPNGAFYDYREHRTCLRRPLGASCLFTNCDRKARSHKAVRVVRQLLLRNVAGYPGKFRDFGTISDWSENVLRPHLPRTAKLWRIGNPVPVVQRPRIRAGVNKSFVFVGRLEFEKAPQDFAEAADIAGVQAVFIGSGKMESVIRARHPNAKFTGWLDREGTERVLSEARMLVFPSRWHEGQPLVPMEAASLGIAAIVSDACAATEQVRHGHSGLIFRSGDAADLAARLKEAQSDDLVERLGREAYADFWAAPPTLESHAKRLMDVYSNIMASRA